MNIVGIPPIEKRDYIILCDFCGIAEDNESVEYMVYNQQFNAAICTRCVRACVEVIGEAMQAKAATNSI